jgi:hypothetical protein
VRLVQRKKRKAEVWAVETAESDCPRVIAKRCTPDEARREDYVYSVVLPRIGDDLIRYFGCVNDEDGQAVWLFVEDARGVPYDSKDAAHALLASEWLGRVHARASSIPRDSRLPELGSATYKALLHQIGRELRGVRGNATLAESHVQEVDSLSQLVDRLLSDWPKTEQLEARFTVSLVHGSFSHRNMRVRTEDGTPRLVVFDWGAAGWGVPARDIAKLLGSSISGDASSYRASAEAWSPSPVDDHAVLVMADLGLLFRAIEHLAWVVPSLKYEWVEVPMNSVQKNHARLKEAASRLLGSGE